MLEGLLLEMAPNEMEQRKEFGYHFAPRKHEVPSGKKYNEMVHQGYKVRSLPIQFIYTSPDFSSE